jgi:cell division protein FtsN
MNQQADGAMRNSRGPMRAFVFAAALAVLTLSATGLASVASAQSNPTPRPETPAPRPDTQGRAPEAPIGHRQPRPQELPPSVQREEGTRTPDQEALDKKLEICRGC